MPIGIPASGKSTFMEKISLEYDIPRVESDHVREELYGDASIQGDFHEVFNEVYRQVRQHLDEKEVCILDATNVTRWVRQTAVFRSQAERVIYIIMDNDLDNCAARNKRRDRVVPEYVLRRMYKNFEKDYPIRNEVNNLSIYHYNDPILLTLLEVQYHG